MDLKERAVQRFVELVEIHSPSGQERDALDYCQAFLGNLGADTCEDDAGRQTGGNAGNLIATFKGDDDSIPTLMLNAHLDTVDPGGRVIPEIRGDRIVSRSDTILGADNKSGVAMILEGMRLVIKNEISRGDIEVVLTVGEETGLLGANALETSDLRSEFGFAFDSSGLGKIVQGAPYYNAIDVSVRGRAAHAGVNPEAGINSISIVSKALSRLRFGAIDHETTANIGIVSGGSGRNVVPGECRALMEIRSHSIKKLDRLTRRLQHVFESEAASYRVDLEGKEIHPGLEVQIKREFDGFYLQQTTPVMETAGKALRTIGRPVELYRNMGGSDANVFNCKGIQTAIIGTGQMAVHSHDEYIKINDLVDGIRLIPELIQCWKEWWAQKIS